MTYGVTFTRADGHRFPPLHSTVSLDPRRVAPVRMNCVSEIVHISQNSRLRPKKKLRGPSPRQPRHSLSHCCCVRVSPLLHTLCSPTWCTNLGFLFSALSLRAEAEYWRTVASINIPFSGQHQSKHAEQAYIGGPRWRIYDICSSGSE